MKVYPVSLFITFEGPEGSGKTTQITLLADHLSGQGEAVLMTREPGGTTTGDAIRTVLLTPQHTEMSPRAETLLFNAARGWQIVDEVIQPALAAGQIVLCDRYADSTLAYQGYGHGQALAPLRTLADYATGRPDAGPDALLRHRSGGRASAQAPWRYRRMESHGGTGAGLSSGSASWIPGISGRGSLCVGSSSTPRNRPRPFRRRFVPSWPGVWQQSRCEMIF